MLSTEIQEQPLDEAMASRIHRERFTPSPLQPGDEMPGANMQYIVTPLASPRPPPPLCPRPFQQMDKSVPYLGSTPIDQRPMGLGSRLTSTSTQSFSSMGKVSLGSIRPRIVLDFFDILNDRWIWEKLSCVVALLSLVAISITLGIFQDKPLPAWPQMISINSMVAIFTAIMKTALMVPITSGLSQLKWLWFREPHRLADMDDFDNASRGPWGSLILLTRPRKHYLASFGAFIILLTLAIDPFSQQIIQYYSCTIENENLAAIPRTNNYTTGGILTTAFQAELDGPMQSSVYLGLIGGPTDDTSLIDFDCASGNCTFPDNGYGTFSTLGMCYTCSDITSNLIKYSNSSAKNPVWWLPGWDNNTQSTIGYTNLDDVTVGPRNYTMINSKGTHTTNHFIDEMFRMEAAMLQIEPNSSCNILESQKCAKRPFAVRCSLMPCVKTYEASIKGGKLNEKLLSSTWLKKTNESDPTLMRSTNLTFSLVTSTTLRNGVWHTCDVSDTPSVLTPVAINADNNTLYIEPNGWPRYKKYPNVPPPTPAPKYTNADCVWFLDYTPALALDRFLAYIFDKELYAQGSDSFGTQGPMWIKQFYQNGTADMDSINAYMRLLTNSITATMRQHGESSPNEYARGSVLASETCVGVRWEWMALPASLVLMTMGFLAATVGRCVATGTYRGAWRSSSLAAYFHGLNTDARTTAGLREATRQSDMMYLAKGIKVRMVGNEGEGGMEVVSMERDLKSGGGPMGMRMRMRRRSAVA